MQMADKKEVQQLEEDLQQALMSLRNLAEEGFERLRKALGQMRDPERRKAELEICQRDYDAFQQHNKEWDKRYNNLSDPEWKRDLLKKEIKTQEDFNKNLEASMTLKPDAQQSDKKIGFTPPSLTRK
jgi:hypothetical protein